MMPCSNKKRTNKIANPIRCYMNGGQKKEIEARWQKLISGGDAKSPCKATDVPLGAKVIRRRKGQKDAPVSSHQKFKMNESVEMKIIA